MDELTVYRKVRALKHALEGANDSNLGRLFSDTQPGEGEAMTKSKIEHVRIPEHVADLVDRVVVTLEADPGTASKLLGPGVVPTRAAVLRAALTVGVQNITHTLPIHG